MKTAPLIVDVDKIVFICILIATSFGIGYIVGVDHAETVQIIAPPKQNCIEPGQIKKLVFDYSKELRSVPR